MKYYFSVECIHSHLEIPTQKLVSYYVVLDTVVPVTAIRNYILSTYALKSVRWQLFFRSYGGPLDEDKTVFVTEVPKYHSKVYIRTKLVNARIMFAIVSIKTNQSVLPATWARYLNNPIPASVQTVPDLLRKIIVANATTWVPRAVTPELRKDGWRVAPCNPCVKEVTHSAYGLGIRVTVNGEHRTLHAHVVSRETPHDASIEHVESLMKNIQTEMHELLLGINF